MDFFKIIHLLVTSPAHLVYEAKISTVKSLLLKLLATMLFVVVLVSLFNTYRTVVYLPTQLTKMFPNTKIENNKLITDSTYTVHAWQLAKIKEAISGMGSSVDTAGGVQMVVSKKLEANTSAPFLLYEDGIIANKDEIAFPVILMEDTLSWNNVFKGENIDFDFSEESFRSLVLRHVIFVFLLSIVSNAANLIILSLYLYLLLGFVFFFSSLRRFISREERARMTLISLLPLYILLPLFTTAGAGWDYFMSISLILSSIVLGRALSFRRKTEFTGDDDE